jgi:catechol 2,3-dioxygenase-like lactoylglutathione lyase family enzyme
MKFDHIAVKSCDISRSVNWYVKNLNATVKYQDETWAIVETSGVKIAFVMPDRHPSHFSFEVTEKFISDKLQDKKFKSHRDGTSSCYIKDPDGNFIEFLKS